MKENMIKAYSWMQAMMKSEKGQGMVEYALVLVFIVAIAAYFLSDNGLGEGIKQAVSDTNAQLQKKSL